MPPSGGRRRLGQVRRVLGRVRERGARDGRGASEGGGRHGGPGERAAGFASGRRCGAAARARVASRSAGSVRRRRGRRSNDRRVRLPPRSRRGRPLRRRRRAQTLRPRTRRPRACCRRPTRARAARARRARACRRSARRRHPRRPLSVEIPHGIRILDSASDDERRRAHAEAGSFDGMWKAPTEKMALANLMWGSGQIVAIHNLAARRCRTLR